MEEIAVSDKESKLLQVIREQNETIQKQQAELKEKEMLIKSLQQERTVQSESGTVGTQDKLLEVEDKNSDFHPMEMDLTNYDKNENQNKKMKGESGHVNEPTNLDDNSAQFKALRNPLILTKLLRNMRSRDLVQICRLVNREWRDLSTDILLKRKNIRVNLLEDKSKFGLAQKNTHYEKQIPEKTLDELTSLLNTSTRFPFVNFRFWGDLKLADAQAFLSEFGSITKGLSLVGNQDRKFMRKLLVEQVPNLESLELQDVEVEGELFSKNSPAPKLPSLTSLKLRSDNSPSLVKEIVEAAGNLQNCTGAWSVEQIELLTPRIHVLKDLILSPKAKELGALKKLTQMKLQLKYFEMDSNCLNGQENTREGRIAKFDRINSKILSLNLMTLKEIHFTPNLFVDSTIEWPELVNVVKLTISGSEICHLRFPSFKISETFPNLYTLCIKNTWDSALDLDSGPDFDSFLDWDSADYEDYSVLEHITPSVKDLRIDGYFMKTFSEYIDNFPNIQHLSLDDISNEDFPSIAAIWNMKKLKSLKLNFFTYWCATAQIDAGFTGMEKGVCQFIGNFGVGKAQVSDIEKFRINPSILNLTELEELHLDYCGRDTKETRASWISFKYAFNLMPKLRVFHEDPIPNADD